MTNQNRKSLYLTRKPGEAVDMYIGDKVISVVFIASSKGRANIRFLADESVVILRSEVELKKENVQ